jgi:glyoxylase-like metal-dependent hydrolase (beta-lactamase superfamily II)
MRNKNFPAKIMEVKILPGCSFSYVKRLYCSQNQNGMKLSVFNISNFKVDGGAMFGVIPKGMWSRVIGADENNNITLCLRSLVVETGGRVILIDAGWGDKQDERFFRYSYLHGGEGLIKGLAGCGYAPGDITDVVLTHLHADHCGGCFRKNADGSTEPVFPNASYHISAIQWEWANESNIREEDAFLPENIKPFEESGRLNLINEGDSICDDIDLRICYGHTPGLLVPVITYKERKIVYTGDLIPTLAHIGLLWNMSYDLLPLATISEKETILEEALANDYILLFQHDEKTECCTLVRTPKGIRAGESGKISDYL